MGSSFFPPGPDPVHQRETAVHHQLPMDLTVPLGKLQCGDSGGPVVSASISAVIQKNVFEGEKYYTCYRRNYLSCHCSFSLDPPAEEVHFTPEHSHTPLRITGFAMGISAVESSAVESSKRKKVTLLQYTSKREQERTREPSRQRLKPQTAHIFDRIQFQTATGTRRNGTPQRLYKLVVELWGEVGSIESRGSGCWIKIATQQSPELVVRGRSPGHYQHARRKSEGGRVHDSRSGHSHDVRAAGYPPAWPHGYTIGFGGPQMHGTARLPMEAQWPLAVPQLLPRQPPYSHHVWPAFGRMELGSGSSGSLTGGFSVQ